MKRDRQLRAVLLGVSMLCITPIANASSGAEPSASSLSSVERAYRDIDFELTASLATAELATGGHDLATTVRLQLLLGLASAALGRHEEAYRAFVVLLAMEPTRKLDHELSPKVRAPYLEARGYWASFSERLAVRAEVRPPTSVALRVTDPAGVATAVRVSFRVPGRAELAHADVEKGALSVPLPKERDPGLEYAVTLLDAAGNAVYERAFRRVFEEPSRSRPHAPPARDASPAPAADRALWLITSAGLALAGLGATAGAAAFHLDREHQADEWNGSGCERPGASRGNQCATVDNRLHESQSWAIGLYATGGALLTASVITLVVAPSAHERPSPVARLRCSPDLRGAFACTGSF